MRKILLLLLTIIISVALCAQVRQTNTVSIKSSGLSIGFLGAPQWPFGLSFDQMFTKKLTIEAGAGIFASGLGVKYYISDPTTRRFNYYTGPYVMVYYDNPSMMYYLPLGISYHSPKSFQYSFDAGIMLSDAIEPLPSFWIGAKIGYRFGKPFTPETDDGSYDDNKPVKKNFVSISVGSTTPIIGVTYERLFAATVGLEAGIGFFSAGVGAKIYPFKLEKERVSFHVGLSHYIFAFVFIGDEWKTYIPIGFDYISDRNIRFSIDSGPVFTWYNSGSANELSPGINFRVGKGF